MVKLIFIKSPAKELSFSIIDISDLLKQNITSPETYFI